MSNMSTIIAKVIAIHNLGLPYDIAEEINGYCFYDYLQVSTRKAKKIVNWKINTSTQGWCTDGHWWFSAGFYPHIPVDENDSAFCEGFFTEQQFRCDYCTKCGNYIAEYIPTYAPPSIICACNTHIQEHHAHEEPDDIYWVETESELDPIETAYTQWCEDYYWNNCY